MSRAALILPALLLAVACGGAEDDARVDDILALEGSADDGAEFFSGTCAGCHAADGSGGSGPALAGAGLEDRVIAEALLAGPGAMPDFSDEDDQTLADLVAFVGGL